MFALIILNTKDYIMLSIDYFILGYFYKELEYTQ